MAFELLAGLWVCVAFMFIKAVEEFKSSKLGENNPFYVAGAIVLCTIITFGSFGIYGGEYLQSSVQATGCCLSQTEQVFLNTTYTYQTVYINNLPSAYGGLVLLFLSILIMLASFAVAKVK